jgi:hypothetical protein
MRQAKFFCSYDLKKIQGDVNLFLDERSDNRDEIVKVSFNTAIASGGKDETDSVIHSAMILYIVF